MGEETESDYRPSGFERIRSLQWLHRIVARRRVEEAIREDHLQTDDPGISKALESGIAWLKRAQDCSHSKDGGVARHYSLINGWSSSYPETSGYIIETLIRYGHLFKDDDALYRARRISDWLCSIQLDCGAFQGGTVDQKPVVPVVFNTGQIVIGLAAACRDDAKYADALHRAASWLVSVQDADGAWRQFPSPFAASDAKTYQAHVAWGLLEASRVLKDEQFAATAVRNIDWTITQQRPNGWLERNCVTDDANPLTHTLAYSLRGLVEAYRYTG
ncbi:MAG: prenyltransferase/squalene oxidase repeat-containing protein, partial [Planctomycetota bacterium]|nr:prenyltransferase/squalene oxidase repeat-containing protein [Planctomycetota bacterium]